MQRQAEKKREREEESEREGTDARHQESEEKYFVIRLAAAIVSRTPHATCHSPFGFFGRRQESKAQNLICCGVGQSGPEAFAERDREKERKRREREREGKDNYNINLPNCFFKNFALSRPRRS